MPITWSAFKTLVLKKLTDAEPSSGDDTLFVEAAAEYVRAQAIAEIGGTLPQSKHHDNRYRELRRKLAGRLCSLTDNALNTAVRTRLRENAADDDTGYRQIAEVVKAQISIEYEQDPVLAKVHGEAAQALKLRMLGRTFTASEAATQTAVRATYLPLDDATVNLDTFLDAHIARARSDLQTFLTYVDGLITASREALESVKLRVDEEILNGALELQEKCVGLRLGNSVSYVSTDVSTDGFASRGLMPEQIRPRAAYIYYNAQDDDVLDANDDGFTDDPCRRAECKVIPYPRAQQEMVCLQSCEPRISFEPAGKCFYVTPILTEDETELRLHFDGIKDTFIDADEIFWGRVEAEAVAAHVALALAMADGDARAMSIEAGRKQMALRRCYRNQLGERELVAHDSEPQ